MSFIPAAAIRIPAAALGSAVVAFMGAFSALTAIRQAAGSEAWSGLMIAIPLIVALVPFLAGLVGGFISRSVWGVLASVGGALVGLIASLSTLTGATIGPADLLSMNLAALATIVMVTGLGHFVGVAVRMPGLVR